MRSISFLSLRVAAEISFLLVISGCALMGGSGNENRVSSLKRSKNYDVTLPTGWEKTERADSDSAYQLRSGAIATVTSSCERDAREPLDILMRHLLIGARKINMVRKERLQVDGVEALYSHVRAQLEGRPFDLHLVVLTRAGCVFDFSLVNPKPLSAEEIDQFLGFVKGFRYVAD
jgi:hypothetical protein